MNPTYRRAPDGELAEKENNRAKNWELVASSRLQIVLEPKPS